MNESDVYKQKLETKIQEFEDFVYIISHDVKAPLRAISNLSEWIEEDLGDHIDAEVQLNLSLLKNRVKRMEMMMNALTEISRVKRDALNVTEVEIAKVIEDIWVDIEPSEHLKLHMKGDFPLFKTYSKKLQTVLRHLLENAVKFHEKLEGTITVFCNDCDSYLKFSIEDTGSGIKENLQKKVFDIFFTVESKEELKSVGAGLSLCKKIIEFVDGQIYLESVEGKGTIVTFHWPKTIENLSN